jgi:hypothetical protein
LGKTGPFVVYQLTDTEYNESAGMWWTWLYVAKLNIYSEPLNQRRSTISGAARAICDS